MHNLQKFAIALLEVRFKFHSLLGKSFRFHSQFQMKVPSKLSNSCRSLFSNFSQCHFVILSFFLALTNERKTKRHNLTGTHKLSHLLTCCKWRLNCSEIVDWQVGSISPAVAQLVHMYINSRRREEDTHSSKHTSKHNRRT